MFRCNKQIGTSWKETLPDMELWRETTSTVYRSSIIHRFDLGRPGQ